MVRNYGVSSKKQIMVPIKRMVVEDHSLTRRRLQVLLEFKRVAEGSKRSRVKETRKETSSFQGAKERKKQIGQKNKAKVSPLEVCIWK